MKASSLLSLKKKKKDLGTVSCSIIATDDTLTEMPVSFVIVSGLKGTSELR